MAKKPLTKASSLSVQKGKQSLAAQTKVDVMIYGGSAGSGKSRLLLTKAGYYAYKDPDFSGVIFRRTSPPLRAAGGLFTEARKLFEPFGAHVRTNAMELEFRKTGGGVLKFTHLENEGDEVKNHQGLQYSFVGFDELTHFTQDMFLYLIGRMRSESETDSFMLGTTNPDPDSWVLDWVEYYLDENGYAIDKLCGKVRYFLIIDDKPKFADTAEELEAEYPDFVWIENDVTGEKQYVAPMTFCFINGTIWDNPALIKANPKYLAALKAQSKVNRMRLLDGCWYARPEGSTHFKRDWVKHASILPYGCKSVRSWDIAHTQPSDKNRYPDYTASIKMYKSPDGDYYIAGDFHPDCKDPIDINKDKAVGKFRKGFGERDKFMVMQAYYDMIDGDQLNTLITVPQESGSGKTQAEQLIKMFTEEGFRVKSITTSNAKGAKERRFSGFSSACENGLVYILTDTFDRKTLEVLLKELEKFDGSASSSSRKDDWVDACSDAFNTLREVKVYSAVSFGAISAPTKVSTMKKTMR